MTNLNSIKNIVIEFKLNLMTHGKAPLVQKHWQTSSDPWKNSISSKSS